MSVESEGTTAARTSGSRREVDDLSQLISGGQTRVLYIVGDNGVGKTQAANELIARVAAHYDMSATVYLPPEGLLRAAEDLLVSSLVDRLVPGRTRGLTPTAMVDEIIDAAARQPVLCLIDNAESLDSGWLHDFVRRWLAGVGRSTLVVTTTSPPDDDLLGPEPPAVRYNLSGLSAEDEPIILRLLGDSLAYRFSTEHLLDVAARVGNVPQRLLYLRWLEPATLDQLTEIADKLSQNLEMRDLVRRVTDQSSGRIVPFFALSRVRAVRFDEAFLAALWDRLGGGSVQAYTRARDSLVALGVLTRAADDPGSFHLNPAVHVQLEKYVSRELAPGQLAQIEYHIGEYYKGLFLGASPAQSAHALNEFVYHSARARNVAEGLRFVLTGGRLQRLRRDGQALGVRRVLTTAVDEIALTADPGGGAAQRFTGPVALVGAVNLELAHALCDLSSYDEALDALKRAEAGVAPVDRSALAVSFREQVAFRRGICLGDSGRLRQAATEYLRVVSEAIAADNLSGVSVLALGYAAVVLVYLQHHTARELGSLSVQLAERLDDAGLTARNCCSYAQVLSYSGSSAEALECIERAETTVGALGDRRELGRVLLAKAAIQITAADVAGAETTLRAASALNAEVGDRRRMARSDGLAAVVALRQGRRKDATRLTTAALDRLVRVGDMLGGLLSCFTLAYLHGVPTAQEAISASRDPSRSHRWAEVVRACTPDIPDINLIARFWTERYAPQLLVSSDLVGGG